LWDGTLWPAAPHRAQVTLTLTHPGALRRMLAYPLDVALGESYVRGDFEIEGDVETAIRIADQALQGVRSPRDAAAVFRLTRGLPQTADGVNQLPVMADSEVIGMLTREDVISY